MCVLRQQRISGCGIALPVGFTPFAVRRGEASMIRMFLHNHQFTGGFVTVLLKEHLREFVTHILLHWDTVLLEPAPNICGHDVRCILLADLRRQVVQRDQMLKRVFVLRSQFVHDPLYVDPHIDLSRPTRPTFALLMLHPVDHVFISGIVPILADQRVETVVLVRLVADRRNLATRQDEEHGLLACLLPRGNPAAQRVSPTTP